MNRILALAVEQNLFNDPNFERAFESGLSMVDAARQALEGRIRDPKRRETGRSEVMTIERKNRLLALADLPPESDATAFALGEDADRDSVRLALAGELNKSGKAKRKANLLDLADASPRKFAPEVQKLVERLVASSSHPARFRDYLDAESALRGAFTKGPPGGGKMDRGGFLDALGSWCNRVGFTMPQVGEGNYPE